MAIRKIKASLVKQDINDYVGESTYIFYDVDTGDLRLWNGNPGGISLLQTTTFTEDNTTSVTADLITAETAKWTLRVQETGTPANVMTEEILATHNGTSVTFTEYAILKLGSLITGLTVNVTLTGGDTLNVIVTSTNPVDIKINRTAVF